ncbi:MAG: hypothetical protein HY689_14005 [Chloroflexi bacterium]|nr:hypothetical protein [Chloroflexota bacterium]
MGKRTWWFLPAGVLLLALPLLATRGSPRAQAATHENLYAVTETVGSNEPMSRTCP